MSTATTGDAHGYAPPRPRGPGIRAVVAVLPDGTPAYAPLATVVQEGARVQCHLCGGWYRSVLAHLRAHGWSQAAYRAAFGLERAQPLEGDDTRSLRAQSLQVRRTFDPAIRAGIAAGQQRARSGELTRAASAAARGRRHPEQRRRRTLENLAAIPAEVGMNHGAVESAMARHGVRRTRHVASRARCADRAAAVAVRFGHPDFASYLADRRDAGLSWRAIAAECGRPATWVRRRAGPLCLGPAGRMRG